MGYITQNFLYFSELTQNFLYFPAATVLHLASVRVWLQLQRLGLRAQANPLHYGNEGDYLILRCGLVADKLHG